MTSPRFGWLRVHEAVNGDEVYRMTNEQWRVDPRWSDDEYAAHLLEHGTAEVVAGGLVAWRRILIDNRLIEHPDAARQRIERMKAARTAAARRPGAAPPAP